jgi:hypothetical protein
MVQERGIAVLMAQMDALEILLQFVGRHLVRIWRIFYVYSGDVERGTGPVEFEFDEGSALLRVGANGESLVVLDHPWQDPFGEPQSAENEAWIAEHGRWARFNVSGESEFSSYIGRTLTSVTALRAAGGNLCGARLVFDGVALDFVGVADEAYVFTEPEHDIRLAGMRVFVAEEVKRSRG